MPLEFRDIEQPVQFVIPRDGKDRPLIVPKAGGKPVPYSRMTTFIDCIEDKSSLTDWGKRTVLLGTRKRPELLERLAEIDPEGERKADRTDREFRAEVDKLVEQAIEASGAHEKREKGTELHGYSELVDQGLPLPESASVSDRLDMAEYALKTAHIRFTHIEKFVVVSDFQVGGTPDRLCGFEPEVVEYVEFPPGASPEDNYIWDLKTGTVEYGGLKMAAQLAGYSRAEFYDPTVLAAPPYARQAKKKDDPEGFERYKAWEAWKSTEFEAELAASAYSPIPPVNQKWGIILNLPSGSSNAELFWVDLEVGWQACELAKVIRATRPLTSKALTGFTTPRAANSVLV